MYTSELIFGLLMLLCCSILHSDGSRRDGDDYSGDEELLFQYFLYKYELKWLWSVESFCRALRPNSCRGIIGSPTIKVQKQELLLEAPGCVKMEVETLSCLYRKNRRNMWRNRRRTEYISGLNGEIYELGTADGICDEYKTAIITNRIHRVHRGDSTSTSAQQSKLLGIARVFEAVNAIRAKERQKTEDRTADNDSDSDGDGDNISHTAVTNVTTDNPFMVFHLVRM